MIYLDASVVLAMIFAEDQRPSSDLWQNKLYSSRLLEYETRNRLHARLSDPGSFASLDDILARIDFVALSDNVLRRALGRFPVHVRTLDALHLATALYLIDRRVPLTVATYDRRLADACTSVGLPLYPIRPPP